MKQTLTVLALAAALIAVTPSQSEACRFPPPTVESSYYGSDSVIRVRLLREMKNAPSDDHVWYHGRVMAGYKGCVERGDHVIIESFQNSCGTTLPVGEIWLIYGRVIGSRGNRTIIKTGQGRYNRNWRRVTASDISWLESRYICCGDECTCYDETQPVSCFANPCDVTTCDVEGATCEANYCGGCHAEWYDIDDYAVCDGACEEDVDCPGGSWCRPTQDDSAECTPFVGPGASCEDLVLPWTHERCTPGLQCVPVEPTGDISGVCATCDDNGPPHQEEEGNNFNHRCSPRAAH